MASRLIIGFSAVSIVCGFAVADTIHLANGVTVDGKVISQTKETVTVKVGEQELIFQTSEISGSIEKNEKTGAFDREKAEAEALEREKEMIALTGLTGPQRVEVTRLMDLLLSAESAVRAEGQRKLVAMGKEVNLFKYYQYWFPSMLPRFVPGVLESLCELDPKRVKPFLKDASANVDALSRAKAIELMGRIQDKDSAGIIVRGLVDHDPNVQIAAAYALGQLKCKEATPVLLACLRANVRQVKNASRTALENIWSTESARVSYDTAADWETFWSSHSGAVRSPYQPSDLKPLVPAGAHFEDE